MPYRSPLWSARYPNLARLKVASDTDANDPDYGINPSYCVISKNAVVAPRGETYRVFDGAYRYSVIDENYEYATLSEAGIKDDYTLSAESKIFSDIPDFPKIPMDLIGRYK